MNSRAQGVSPFFNGKFDQCHWHSPQNFNIFDRTAPDINDTGSTQWRSWQISHWEANYIMATQQALWARLIKASYALLLLSIFWTAGTMAYSYFESIADPNRILAFSLIRAGIFIATGSMWTSMIVSANPNGDSVPISNV